MKKRFRKQYKDVITQDDTKIRKEKSTFITLSGNVYYHNILINENFIGTCLIYR